MNRANEDEKRKGRVVFKYRFIEYNHLNSSKTISVTKQHEESSTSRKVRLVSKERKPVAR
jgi:hypothetical protein